MLTGHDDALYFGRYRAQSESALARMARPPKKARYVGPTILWLVGFFVVFAFVGRTEISTPIVLFLLTYVAMLPALLTAAFAYNLFIYRARYRRWEAKFICRDCGAIVDPSTSLAARTVGF